jgi:hypothetical protein
VFDGEVVPSRVLGNLSPSDGAPCVVVRVVWPRTQSVVLRNREVPLCPKEAVKNRSKPEGSIAVGYVYDDALRFCTEYLQEFQYTSRRIWDADEEDRDTKEVLQGTGKDVLLSDADLYNIHDSVIHNKDCTVELLQ